MSAAGQMHDRYDVMLAERQQAHSVVYKSYNSLCAFTGTPVPSLYPSQRPQHLHTPLQEGQLHDPPPTQLPGPQQCAHSLGLQCCPIRLAGHYPCAIIVTTPHFTCLHGLPTCSFACNLCKHWPCIVHAWLTWSPSIFTPAAASLLANIWH